jgi:hypothetical protein
MPQGLQPGAVQAAEFAEEVVVGQSGRIDSGLGAHGVVGHGVASRPPGCASAAHRLPMPVAAKPAPVRSQA